MKRVFLILLAALSAAWAAPEAPDMKGALARLNEAERARLAGNPAAMEELTRLTKLQSALIEEAKAQRWAERPEVMARVERSRLTAISESWLEHQSAPPAGFPSEDEVNAYYESHKARWHRPRQWHLAHIFVTCPRGATAAQEASGKAAMEKIRALLAEEGADFAAIARKHSGEASSAATGGLIGWLTEDQVQPEIRNKITSLRLGQVSEPLRLADGWHFIRCLDKREANTPVLVQIKDAIVQEMRELKSREISAAYIARLMEKQGMVAQTTTSPAAQK
jgi:hypothetical protein